MATWFRQGLTSTVFSSMKGALRGRDSTEAADGEQDGMNKRPCRQNGTPASNSTCEPSASDLRPWIHDAAAVSRIAVTTSAGSALERMGTNVHSLRARNQV